MSGDASASGFSLVHVLDVQGRRCVASLGSPK